MLRSLVVDVRTFFSKLAGFGAVTALWNDEFCVPLCAMSLEVHPVTEALSSSVDTVRTRGSYGSDGFHWTASTIVLSIFLFFAAGLAEVGGGWLVWQAVRVQGRVVGKPWWQDKRAVMSAVLGSLALVGYGFIPTAQPPPTFGRLYAVYGGFFIVLSFTWGWVVDKDRPDKGA